MTKEEERLQSKCFIWFWNTLIDERMMLFHVDNNSWNATIGAMKKALGVVKGVSDFVLILSLGRVCWIEMKTPTGIQEEVQKMFQQKVEARGHEYVILRTFEEFQHFILNKLLYE